MPITTKIINIHSTIQPGLTLTIVLLHQCSPNSYIRLFQYTMAAKSITVVLMNSLPVNIILR
ncbi:hypothetical protein [Methanobrevibacter arboriphilus]|uniref:hypothetical protein n=1 Tax=Methanobrevibacter arboriphilus TaxID=39441 RepID=UPI00117D5255|nr:hypothetical protein [Methanobrevibacter arboriphilus]